MLRRRPPKGDLDSLVSNMFRDVFTEDERADLHARIAAWERANPGRSGADRVTAWIDIAYAYQAERVPVPDMSTPRIIGPAVRLQLP